MCAEHSLGKNPLQGPEGSWRKLQRRSLAGREEIPLLSAEATHGEERKQLALASLPGTGRENQLFRIRENVINYTIVLVTGRGAGDQ